MRNLLRGWYKVAPALALWGGLWRGARANAPQDDSKAMMHRDANAARKAMRAHLRQVSDDSRQLPAAHEHAHRKRA